nr:Sensor protein ZraS [Chlamydiota bacterium]
LTLNHNDRELEISTSFVPEKGLLLLLRDVTDLRRLEQAVDRNDRLRELGEMAATLAHEIRNPLGGIEGFASLLLRDLKEEPKQREMAHSIIDGTRTLNRLVSNVLHFARPLDIHFALTNLVSVIEEVIDLVDADESEAKSCTFHTPESSLSTSLDRSLIKMALLNLVRNGLQASPEGGNITVKLWKSEEVAHIAITDQGEGIAAKNLEKIFTPFYTTKCSGTGLGLSETDKIIKAHGGTIEIDSKVGQGSTFTIKLPLENGN